MAIYRICFLLTTTSTAYGAINSNNESDAGSLCYRPPNKCLFFLPFFFLSHPICENFSPGALLYQAPAAAVILDMAGSRYRKTARAHSTQKNLEIPLIYPRLWLQSKLVEKRK